MIRTLIGSPNRRAKHLSCWASCGCYCRSSPAELHAASHVDVEEQVHVEVTLRPRARHVVDACPLLVLTNDTLRGARRRHLVERAGVLRCVENIDTRYAVRSLPTKILVTRDYQGGWRLVAV